MPNQDISRKLAVIVHADVAGSTVLVQRDETLAHKRINAAFQRFSSIIQDYNGTVHEIRGDALIAGFTRASDAVCAALFFQESHAAHNAELSDDIVPVIRIGIALGEEIFADGTVTGAGVVLAQRVEQLSEPGGVCITGAIHEAIPHRMPVDQENLGEQEVKGFEEPVRVYRVALKPGEPIPPPEGAQRPEVPSRRRTLVVVAIAAALVIAGAAVLWLRPWLPEEKPASLDRMASPLPDKPSIVVLPFANMSDDPKQEYFVDGMTEDLITDLSKISGLFVIARNSAFTYKGKPVKVQQVAEELGVRYVLEGSVRRAGDQVRINTQLIDATTGGHLWAERYDGSLDNVFAMQDEVTQKIVTALAVTLTTEETARYVGDKPNSPDAYDAFLRGWANYQLHGPDDLARAVPYFEKAIDLEPGYSNAHAALAAVYWESWNNGWVESLGTSFFRALKRARTRLEEAMKNPTPLAHRVASNIFASQGEYEQAVTEAQRAIILEPNNATGHAALADALILAGNAGKAVDSIETAMRLDPLHPGYLITLGQAQFAMEHFKDAAVTLERAVERNPENEWAWLFLAATYGHLGRAVDGQAAIERYNELRIQQGLPELLLEQLDYWGIGRGTYRDRVLAGLTQVPEPKWRALITGDPSAGYKIKGVTTIDAATAKMLHERGALFVELRYYAQDWIAGHIPGAIWLEPGRVSRITLGEIADKDQELVFYSTVGTPASAAEASAKAVTWGYKSAYHFPEGTAGWRVAGYPLEMGE